MYKSESLSGRCFLALAKILDCWVLEGMLRLSLRAAELEPYQVSYSLTSARPAPLVPASTLLERQYTASMSHRTTCITLLRKRPRLASNTAAVSCPRARATDTLASCSRSNTRIEADAPHQPSSKDVEGCPHKIHDCIFCASSLAMA